MLSSSVEVQAQGPGPPSCRIISLKKMSTWNDNETIPATESESDDDQPRFDLSFRRPPPVNKLHHQDLRAHELKTNGTLHGQEEQHATRSWVPAVMQISSLTGIIKTENDVEAIVRTRPPGHMMQNVKQEEEKELVLVEDEDDEEISESSADSLDDIDDDDLLLDDSEDLKENRLGGPSISAGLRSLLPSPSHHPLHDQATRHEIAVDDSNWWLLLPDFVPVRELARGIDPRNHTKVHVIYEKQFTSESSSAHSRDKDKNLGPGGGGVLYDDDVPVVKKSKKRKISGDGSGSGGSWFHSEGRKIFRDAQGNELTGRAAWKAYKGEGKARKKGVSKKMKFKRGKKRGK